MLFYSYFRGNSTSVHKKGNTELYCEVKYLLLISTVPYIEYFIIVQLPTSTTDLKCKGHIFMHYPK